MLSIEFLFFGLLNDIWKKCRSESTLIDEIDLNGDTIIEQHDILDTYNFIK